jgi:pimeloyl-ACP methyl ester carboxylesterase
MIWIALVGAFEVGLPRGGEAVVNLVLENRTDTSLKEPWIFVFSKPDWLSVSPDSVITKNLAKGEKVELQLRLKGEPSWSPALCEGELRLRVLVRNGEVAPDFMDFKVKEEPAEIASLVPFLLAREYEFTHTLTEHYDYYPVIFLHGLGQDANYWISNRDNPLRAESMVKIVGFQGYWLYRNGQGIEPYSTLASTIGSIYPKRVIYNFTYYKEPWEENPGAIGSKGRVYPVDPDVAEIYRKNLGYPDPDEPNSYARRLSFFINAVCESAYTDKVHIVAHSLGGVVARAAMGWYDCNDKVNRLLMIATPNHPPVESIWDKLVIFVAYKRKEFPEWAFSGELAEVRMVPFTAGFPHVPDYYLNYLNRSSWQGNSKFSIISGNMNASGIGVILYPFDFNLKDDGLLNYETVYLSGARFAPVHYSAHGTQGDTSYGIPGIGCLTWFFNTYGEMSLTANTFTTEFIKT